MHYMFLIYRDERASLSRSAAEVKAGMASHTPYIEMLRRNGQYAASDALGPAQSARTLRGAGGKPVATEGPFAESREQLGGFYVVVAKDLDEAIAIASHCPALKTVAAGIEIRPIPAPLVAERPPPAPSDRTSHQRYLLALYRDETARGAQEEEAPQPTFMQPLAPSGSATSLRLRDGKVALTDGPFSESPEQLSEYGIVWARDMDEAVGLASQVAEGAPHAVEVRPIRTGA